MTNDCSCEIVDGNTVRNPRCVVHAIAISDIHGPPPVCTGSYQAIVGYLTHSPQHCPICERDVEVVTHALGFCFALHPYRPATKDESK